MTNDLIIAIRNLMETRTRDLVADIREILTTDDFDTAELLARTNLLHRYSYALDQLLTENDDYPSRQLLTLTTEEHLTIQ